VAHPLCRVLLQLVAGHRKHVADAGHLLVATAARSPRHHATTPHTHSPRPSFCASVHIQCG
jgi:hypothetical protein